MSKYKVGDVCRVKHRHDMPDNPKFGFTSNMTYMCGRRFTIKSIYPNGEYRSEEGVENRENHPSSPNNMYISHWSISEDMLEIDSEYFADITEPINDINIKSFFRIIGE